MYILHTHTHTCIQGLRRKFILGRSGQEVYGWVCGAHTAWRLLSPLTLREDHLEEDYKQPGRKNALCVDICQSLSPATLVLTNGTMKVADTGAICR